MSYFLYGRKPAYPLIYEMWLDSDAMDDSWAADTWTLSNGVLVNTPALGTELLTNGNMEDGDPPTGWSAIGASTLSSVADERTGGAGSKSLNVVRGSNQTVVSKSTSSGRVEWHYFDSWLKNVDADFTYALGMAVQSLAVPDTSWTRRVMSGRIPSATALTAYLRINSAGQARLDDVSFKKITRASLFATRQIDISNFSVIFPAIAGYEYATQIGVVLCADSPTDPQNFVIAYCTSSDASTVANGIVIERCIAGTYTVDVLDLDFAPGNGRHFSATKIGDQLYIFFGTGDFQTLVGGAPITLPSALESNQYHGMMSTCELNSFNRRFALFDAISPSVQAVPSSLNVVFGGTSITNADYSHRRGVTTWLQRTYRNSTIAAHNASLSGRTSWNNLLRIQTDYLDQAPSLIIFDNANDDVANVDAKCVEALVRRVWTEYPDCKFAFLRVFNVSDRLVDAGIDSPVNAGQQAELDALATHYGIPVANYWQRIKDLVAAGNHLQWYLVDTVHPTALGHSEATKLLQDILTADFLNDRQSPVSLPARLYDNGDYENPATVKNGTDYDSSTGSWTTTGTQISSSSAGATVTFSATCQSIGRPEEDGTVQISVDGGAFVSFVFAPNGEVIASGVRAAHTITIKVMTGTVTISKFWAI